MLHVSSARRAPDQIGRERTLSGLLIPSEGGVGNLSTHLTFQIVSDPDLTTLSGRAEKGQALFPSLKSSARLSSAQGDSPCGTYESQVRGARWKGKAESAQTGKSGAKSWK